MRGEDWFWLICRPSNIPPAYTTDTEGWYGFAGIYLAYGRLSSRDRSSCFVIQGLTLSAITDADTNTFIHNR